MVSTTDISDFQALFTGNDSAYGSTIVGEVVNGKAEAKCTLKHDPITPAVLSRHLNGEESIGIAPLMSDNTVLWGAIDIDDYVGDLMLIVDAIHEFDLPIVPCYSKSRKLHLYFFFADHTDAQEAIDYMRSYLPLFRCNAKTEIFPKQARTTATHKFYSWINIPYFDADSNNHRKMIKERNVFGTVQEFIAEANAKKLTLTEHISRRDSLPYVSAPPCIASGAILRDVQPGIRNQWFYNVACYLRMEDENIELDEPLLELNDTLSAPLPRNEILSTVAKINKKTYFYQCANMLGCDKSACKKADNGIANSTKNTGFDFGQLYQVHTDPIQWRWEINGVPMWFHTTKELMNQSSCQRLCAEKLHRVFNTVSSDKWTKLVNRALETVIDEYVEMQGEFGAGATFAKYVAEYFAGGRHKTEILEQVRIGKIYDDGERYVFSATSFMDYIIGVHKVDLTAAEIRERIVSLGAKPDGAYWAIDKAAVPAPLLQAPELEIDYKDKESEDSGSYQF